MQEDERSFQEPAKAWLNHFEVRRRSTVSNWLHHAVRAGANTAADVLMVVRGEARIKQGSRWSVADDQAFAAEVLRCLEADRDGARTYAEYVLKYESLPRAQREALKDGRAAHHREQYLRQQPATEKQVAYLRSLGYVGAVTSKQHASELIEQLKKQGGRP